MKTTLLILSFLFLGCATIVQPGPDRVQVRSQPEGAKVYLDGMPVGTTPMLLSINRKDEGLIEIKKDGYETITIDRDKVVNGWLFGNLFLGGGVGIIIDLATSNQGKYSDDPIYVEMSQAGDRVPVSIEMKKDKEPTISPATHP